MRVGLASIFVVLGIVACTSESKDTPTEETTGGTIDAGPNGNDSGNNQTDGATPGNDGGADAEPTTPAIRYVGRFDTSDPAGPRVSWPGARVIVRFSGTELKVKTTQAAGGQGTSYYDVIVDGTVQNTPFKPADGQAETSVATALAA